MWRARAFGLRLDLAWRLRGLSATRGRADVRVSAGRETEEVSNARREVLRLPWPRTGVCDVADGTSITFRPKPGISARSFAEAGLQCALGAVLHQRRRLVLHASGVLVGEQALLIVGSPGTGKSTLAAALATMGHAVLCDDVALIVFRHGRPVVPPGLPGIRLPSDAAQRLRLEGHRFALPAATKEIVFGTPGQHVRAVPPLGAVVLLTRGVRYRLRSLSGYEAWGALAANYYARSLLTPAEHPRLLRDVARAVTVASVAVVTCADSMRELDSLATSLISDLC